MAGNVGMFLPCPGRRRRRRRVDQPVDVLLLMQVLLQVAAVLRRPLLEVAAVDGAPGLILGLPTLECPIVGVAVLPRVCSPALERPVVGVSVLLGSRLLAVVHQVLDRPAGADKP